MNKLQQINSVCTVNLTAVRQAQRLFTITTPIVYIDLPLRYSSHFAIYQRILQISAATWKRSYHIDVSLACTMSAPTVSRPVRRTRKKIALEDDENDVTAVTEASTLDGTILEEDQTSIQTTTRSSPRKTRRSAIDVLATPKSTTNRRRTTMNEENIEPTELFDPDLSIAATPKSPTKRGSPKRRPAAVKAKTQEPAIAEVIPQVPIPKSSILPEISLEMGPLSDITKTSINEQSIIMSQKAVDEPPKPKSSANLFEKPMDIVVRTRALGMPKTMESEIPKRRTIIKHLVLINFKSYAGRQEVGPFHASFSSVVGPNGSGKSNVIDSLLFVFGFRASKMRQGKISALIHNSAAFPDLDFCEVQVHFEEVEDGPGGTTQVVPDSQLVVSRKAYKSNSSDYFMDGKRSNFTAVTTLLRERGIDLDHKRFLILQGEVESIAQMKPKAGNEHEDGLLEYLEDIIGTSKYKTPIEESGKEVEALNDICVEKSGRVQHVEKEKRALEDKKNEALAFIRDENELIFKQSALYQVYIHDCNDNLKVTEEAVNYMQAKLDEEVDKHKGSEDGIKLLEKAYAEAKKQREVLEKNSLLTGKELAKFEKEKVKLEEKKKFLANKHKKLEKALNTSRLSASEAASLVQKFTDDVERNGQEVAGLETRMKAEAAELANIRDSLKDKTQAFSDQIVVKQEQLAPWNEKINDKRSAIAVAQSELDILKEKASAGAVALKESLSKIENLEELQQTKIRELDQHKKNKAELEKELAKAQQDVEKMAQQEPEMRTRLSNSRQKEDEARASLTNTQSRGNVLNGLMRLRDSGRIEGFHGRLGNLGTIDEKYDVAVSTACAALNNMVVDTVEVGQQCIDYLRKNNLGRANFILLDRLAKKDMGPLNTPEQVPRLFDLIKSKDDIFRPAFYSVLQNTLVAKDLGQANRIAYGSRRWRVVTLDGQLIDVSGTMSGGGSRVARGGMSSKPVIETTPQIVEKLETERNVLEKSFAEFQSKYRSRESRIKELFSQIPDAEIDMQKIKLELESLVRNITDAQRRVNDIQIESQASKVDSAQTSSLEKQISRFETELAELHAQSSGLSLEIKELQDKIMEVGGVQLRSQKAKVDGLKEQIDTLSEETSNAELSKSRAIKDKAKHEKAQIQSQKDLDGVIAGLQEVDNDSQDQAEAFQAAKEKADGARLALEDKDEELTASKSELEAKTAELNETRAIEIEMKNKLEENQKVYAENQKKFKHWSEKLSKIKLTPLDDLGEEVQEGAGSLPEYSSDELKGMSKDSLKAEIAALEEKLQNIRVDLDVLTEYRRRVEEHNARSMDLATAVESRDTAKRRSDELRRLRLEGFMEGFSLISLRLKEMYQMITMGGNAELELVDSLDPFSEGILFSVMPPKKSWKNISNLSGGEKTLSSLALVFALHHYKPTPLYVMDEIDAALDFRNVSIVASYIKERTKNAQFIVISLRNNMFELAARLVGVYKVNHMVSLSKWQCNH